MSRALKEEVIRIIISPEELRQLAVAAEGARERGVVGDSLAFGTIWTAPVLVRFTLPQPFESDE